MLSIFLLVPSQNLVIASRKTARINPSKVCLKDPVWFTETKACLGILAKRGISVNKAARLPYTPAATLPLITVPPTMTWTCKILFPRLYSDANTHLETKLLQGWSLKAKLPFHFLLLQYTYCIFTILFIILPFPLHLSLSLGLSPTCLHHPALDAAVTMSRWPSGFQQVCGSCGGESLALFTGLTADPHLASTLRRSMALLQLLL